MFSRGEEPAEWTSLRPPMLDSQLAQTGSLLNRPSTALVSKRYQIQQNMFTHSNDIKKDEYPNNIGGPSTVHSAMGGMRSSSLANMKNKTSPSFYKTPPTVANIDSDEVQARLLKLQNETGYEIIQRHGQRIFGGPPPGWQGELPGKGTEVYCFRIPRDCFEDELVPVFSKVGPIFELRLMIEFSGTNRTFCYVRYTKKEHAMEAIQCLDGYEIRGGQRLSVIKSVDNRRLWINGIPKNRSAEGFKEELGLITEGINSVILYPSQTEANRTRSYMFVEYESHRAAALARRKLVPGKVFLFGVEVGQVDWAEPEPEVDEQQMLHVKILYVRHLNMATTEETLWKCFQQLSGGQVERVKKSKDFAFVHFTTRESAEIALKRCSHLDIDGQKVDVLWAKPPDREHIAKRLDRDVSRSESSSAAAPQDWSPAQIISAFCSSQQWGEPEYKLTCARHPNTGIPLYHYSVIIPRYPLPFPANFFQVQKWMMSDIAAKSLVAQHILSHLKIGQTQSPVYPGYSTNQSLDSFSLVYLGQLTNQSRDSFSSVYSGLEPNQSPVGSPSQPRDESIQNWSQVFSQFGANSSFQSLTAYGNHQ